MFGSYYNRLHTNKLDYSLNQSRTNLLYVYNIEKWEEKQRNQRRKVEHNTQGLHTMERMINSSPYTFIYMCKVGPAQADPYGQCHPYNLTLSPHVTIF